MYKDHSTKSNLFNRHLWQNLIGQYLSFFIILQAATKSIVFCRHFNIKLDTMNTTKNQSKEKIGKTTFSIPLQFFPKQLPWIFLKHLIQRFITTNIYRKKIIIIIIHKKKEKQLSKTVAIWQKAKKCMSPSQLFSKHNKQTLLMSKNLLMEFYLSLSFIFPDFLTNQTLKKKDWKKSG